MWNFSLHRPATQNSNQLFNWLSIRTEFALSLVLLVAVSRLLTGDYSPRILIMLVGSLLSIGVLHALSKGMRQHLMTGILSFIPYLLGMYLFFIEGFWRLTQIVQNLSILEVVLVIFYFIIGHSLASTGYTAITQAKRLNEGH